jgi:hypothetical protein
LKERQNILLTEKINSCLWHIKGTPLWAVAVIAHGPCKWCRGHEFTLIICYIVMCRLLLFRDTDIRGMYKIQLVSHDLRLVQTSILLLYPDFGCTFMEDTVDPQIEQII